MFSNRERERAKDHGITAGRIQKHRKTTELPATSTQLPVQYCEKSCALFRTELKMIFKPICTFNYFFFLSLHLFFNYLQRFLSPFFLFIFLFTKVFSYLFIYKFFFLVLSIISHLLCIIINTYIHT